MRFLPVNVNAMLIELQNLEETQTLYDALMQNPIVGIKEMVPAACTVMVTFYPAVIAQQDLINLIAQCDIRQKTQRNGKLIEIPVYYNGEDLADVAGFLDISMDEVIKRHTEAEYRVAFTGFAPGFAYLSGGHPSFQIPRRQIPRTRIPASAVALAGDFSGVYPFDSPGGWQIIGITPLTMWDIHREEPALLQPGYRVKFTDAGQAAVIHVQSDKTTTKQVNLPRQTACTTYLTVKKVGVQAIFQDQGRPGKVQLGVAQSGALDQSAFKAANALVGNATNTGCIEIVYGQCQFQMHGQGLIAVTGAINTVQIQTASGQQHSYSTWQAIAVEDGDVITLASPLAGVRNYLAVRGGFDEKPVLDSVTTDILARVGPAPIVVGDQLGVMNSPYMSAVSTEETPLFDLPKKEDVVVLDIVLGPRTDWFTQAAITQLTAQTWTVTPQSNRIGLRLHGELPLTRLDHKELPSEGTAVGAIQVPASGQPVLFLADHPLTGGYPVIGAVATYHLDLAGQIPIGASIQFNPITVFTAHNRV